MVLGFEGPDNGFPSCETEMMERFGREWRVAEVCGVPSASVPGIRCHGFQGKGCTMS